MNEWHPRYKERGIMIYWHVDTKSMVVHSQIKTCLSSEVGAMITGVLKHDTKMNMSKAYTDTMDKAPLDLGSVTALALICYHVLKGSNARNCTIQVPPKKQLS